MLVAPVESFNRNYDVSR